MFKKLKEALKNMSQPRPSFDPASLDDPLAMETAWTPLKKGGTNFRTRKLVFAAPHRIEFRPSVGAYLFGGIFFGIGLGLVIGFPTAIFLEAIEFDWGLLIPMFVGATFTVIGAVMLYVFTRPVVLDAQLGYFWRNAEEPEGFVIRDEEDEKYVAIPRIRAIQIIREYCSGNKSSYYSFEINLVLDDGRRVNVIDHGNHQAVRQDADTLAQLLEVPVWDAS